MAYGIAHKTDSAPRTRAEYLRKVPESFGRPSGLTHIVCDEKARRFVCLGEQTQSRDRT